MLTLTPKLAYHYELYRRGLRSYQAGDWLSAVTFYQQALDCRPDWSMGHYLLGVVFDQQSRFEHAARRYEQAIALDPTYGQAIEHLGCVYLKQGQVDRAIEQLQRAIELNPCQSSLWNNLGQALYASRYGHSSSVHSIKNGHQANAQLTHRQWKSVQQAIEAYERALQLQPNSIIAHLNLGYLWLDQEQVDRAIAQFQRVLTLDPSHMLAHSHCGQLYFRQGKLAAAVEHWRQIALQHQPLLRSYCQRVEQEQPQLHQGHDSGDLRRQAQQACAQFLQGLLNHGSIQEISQHLQQAYEHLGSLVMQCDGASLADYYFRQALRIQPHHAGLLFKLGQSLEQQQRRDGAIALYSLASSLSLTNRPCLANSPVSSIPQPSTTQDHNRPYCQSSTTDWVKTTAIACLYRPVNWPFSPSPPPRSLASPSPRTPVPPLPPSPCSGLTCPPCMAYLRAKFQPYLVRPHVFRCVANGMDPGALDPFPSFATFVVTIPEGRCWVEPHRNSWAICDNIAVLTSDRTLLNDVSRSYPWPLPGCQRPQGNYHRFLNPKSSLPPVHCLDGRVLLASGLSGHMYYHWMMDVLPRLEIFRRGGWQWSEMDAIVVNSTQQSFQRETLAVLGVPEATIIESDRHPYLQAKELIVPSFPGYLTWVPKATVEYLRSQFLPAAAQIESPLPFDSFPPYLYISRAHASYRQLVNEADLLQHLQPLGFVAVQLETLTVLQQVALFAHAKIVVAPHGSGLTNTVFCQPDTQVVEIASPHYVHIYYWVLSHQVGLQHYLVTGQTVSCSLLRQVMYQNPLPEDIWLPEDTIQSMVALLLGMIQGETP